MATSFSRAINSIKRAEKQYSKMADYKTMAENYASLWNDLRSELHKANVRIRRLEEFISENTSEEVQREMP